MKLSISDIMKLASIVSGEAPKRSASHEAARKRFISLADEKGINGQLILAASDPFHALDLAMNPRPVAVEAPVSPGLARLRASKNAEAIRAATIEDGEKARAEVVAPPVPRIERVSDKELLLSEQRGGDFAATASAELDRREKAREESAKQPKAAKPAADKAPAVRSRIAPEAVISAVIANPKKAGSRSHARFALYTAGATVQQFIDACVAAGFPATEAKADLSWDSRKSFITIEAA